MNILGIGRNGTVNGTEEHEAPRAEYVRELAAQITQLSEQVRRILPDLDPALRREVVTSLDYQRQMMAMADALTAPVKGDPHDPARRLAVDEWVDWAEDQGSALRELLETDSEDTSDLETSTDANVVEAAGASARPASESAR